MRLAFAILGGAMAAGSFGQTGHGFDTVEARMGRAEAVYRGRIADVSGKGEFDAVRAVFRVDETVKGSSKGRIVLSSGEMLTDAPLSHYRAWVSRGTPFLLFVRRPKRGDGEPPFRLLRLGPPSPEEKDYPSDGDRGLVAMDLTLLRTPAAILDRARRFAKRHPGVTGETVIEIPESFAARYGSRGDWNGIVIPKVPEIEPSLREMIATPGKVLGGAKARPFELAALRHSAILALADFRSPASVSLLRRQLGDPFVTTFQGPEPERARRVYWIREAAAKVLKGWGVAAENAPLLAPSSGFSH